MTNILHPDAFILACWAPQDPLLTALELDPALIPMGDKPMLQRVVEKLVDLGCQRIAVVHGDRPQQGETLLGDGERWGCQITHVYAADGSHPLGLLARLAPGDERNCILAPADTVALSDFDASKPCAVYSTDTWHIRWTGWAVMTGNSIRALAEKVRSSQDLERQIMASVDLEAILMRKKTTISTSSIAATLDSLPTLFDRSPGSTGISRRPHSTGIWIGNGSRIHPSARLHAPVFIGQNVLVAEEAEIGPNAAIGDGCVIDIGSHIEDSVLLQNTYIGQKLDVRRTLLAGNHLVNASLGIAIRISDPEFLRDTDRADHGRPRVPLKQRLLAALLWPCLMPFRLLWQFRSLDGVKTAPAAIGTPTSVAAVYRPLQVSFAMTHSDVQRAAFGAWANHFLHTFLPGLADVIAGKVALLGLQPRTAEEITALPLYWQRLYVGTPIGLVNEALLFSTEEALPEMLYAADALCVAPIPLPKVLKLLRQYARRVMTEVLKRHPKPVGAAKKVATQPAP